MPTRPGLLRRTLSGALALAMVFVAIPAGAFSATTKTPAPPSVKTSAFSTLSRIGTRVVSNQSHAQSNVLNVRWRKGVTKAQITAAAGALGFTAESSARLGWSQLTTKGSATSGSVADMLRKAGLVTQAAPSLWVTASDVSPSDPLFPTQWALSNTGQDGGTSGADISAKGAWTQSVGSKNVIVAVVDEGVNYAHPDLKNNMWLNTKEIPNNGIDDDHDGYVDDVRGWDFVNGDNTVYDATDGDRHGTHVSGIIGAEGNNGIGISGVNQHVTIMPVKFLGPAGGSDFDGAQAIVFAVDHGATVINCSWGGSGDSQLLDDAVAYAASKGVIIVCAAGNSAWDNDDPTGGFIPASIDATNIVAVAATDRDDKLANFSNYGADSVDLAAPGVDVTSTLPAAISGIYTDSLLMWKALYIPVALEDLLPASARDAAIAASVRQFGETTDTPILVVDGSVAKVTSETPGVRLATYTSALAGAGFTDVSTWVVEDAGTPTQKAMSGKIVLWFTGAASYGYYGQPCLSESDQVAISECLENGGELALISGEAATDLQMFGATSADAAPDGTDIISYYFGARWVDLMPWAMSFKGKSGSAFAGIEAALPADADVTAADAIARVNTDSGTGVLFTGEYAPLSGTSMAAPHVTGAIALLKAKFPASTSDELVARVENTVDRKASLAGKVATGGRLNLAAAMGAYPGRVTITAPKKGDRLHTGTASTLRWAPAAGGAAGATFTAQVGLPYTAYSEGFESGTLGGFTTEIEGATPWMASKDTTAVRSGSWGAESTDIPASRPATDMGPGWWESGMTSMQTTVTIPDGGADISFYWRMPEADGWDISGAFFTDEGGAAFLDNSQVDDPTAWMKQTVHVSSGDHAIYFMGYNGTKIPSNVHMYVDDITITAHEFTDLGTAGAGATSLGFTVPGVATDDAWFRVQSHLNGVDSSWATVKGVKLVSDAVAPAAPSGLTLTPDTDGGVAITWTNPSDPDLDRVVVVTSTEHMPTSPTDASATVAYEGTGTATAVSGLKHGTPVYVSAWAVDTSDNWSPVRTAQTVAVDRTAPEAPRRLRVKQFAPAIPLLTWGTSEPSAKATVLRRYDTTPTVGDPDAMLVDNVAGFALDWDLDPDAPRAYYTVYLTDESGNVSAPSSVSLVLDSKAITGDIAVRSDMTDPASEMPIVETSSVWVDANVINATEMRVTVDGETDPDADFVPFASEFKVDLLPLHGVHTISVEFRGPNSIAPVTMDANVLVILHAPYAPTGLTAESWNTGVKVAWDTPSMPDEGATSDDPSDPSDPSDPGMPTDPGSGVSGDPTLASYRLYEAPTAVGPWTIVGETSVDEMSNGSYFVAGLFPGLPHFFKADAVDVLGNPSELSEAATGTPGVGVRRFQGANRAAIAAAASASIFESGSDDPYIGDSYSSDYVVIAPATDYMQALAANSIAGRYRASVLVAGAGLTSESITEIKRLGVHRAIVVGTSAAVAPAVDLALKGLGIKVERISGADGYDVAAKVARRMSATLTGSLDALVVDGASTTDMCSLMPVAYASGRPVLPVKPTSIPAPIKALLAMTKFTSFTIVGGPVAVSAKVASAFGKLASVERVAGKSGSDTSVALANWAVDGGFSTWGTVSVTDPKSWSSSLSIGAATGNGIVLVTPGKALNAAVAGALRSNAESIGMVNVFGGTGVVTSAVQSKIRSAMSIKYSGVIAGDEIFGPDGS